MTAVVYLHPTKLGAISRGHPWIFPKAISKSFGNLRTGELVKICSMDDKFLGVGIYNEHSLYRVRVLLPAWECTPEINLETIVRLRLQKALLVRRALGLPSELTNAFRLFNSEADGLSGLTIDFFNGTLVVASSAYWVEAHKETISHCIKEILKANELIWLAQVKPLNQDGWKQAEATVVTDSVVEIREAGVRYQVRFEQAQKTGLFLDQRENHQRLAALTKGKRVLDLYTYTGGFALHAAQAGALQVTAVDSSAAAIQQARQNAELNGFRAIEFIEADARDYLKHAADYDVVILDPPKLVPSQQHLEKAKNYYRFLHREVLKVMQTGALLMTCNCSSALNTADFCNLINQQASAVQRQVRILGIYGPASCHPTLPAFPEGNYLTAVLLAVV